MSQWGRVERVLDQQLGDLASPLALLLPSIWSLASRLTASDLNFLSDWNEEVWPDTWVVSSSSLAILQFYYF